MVKDMRANWCLGLLAVGALLICFESSALAFVGVRALGMGGAYTAVADDAAAVFWNPAGLMQVKEPSVGTVLAFHRDAADSYESFVSYLEPDSGYGAGALSWYYGRLDPVADPSGMEYGEIHDFCYSLAKPAGQQVYLGGNVRYRREREAFADGLTAGWTGDIAGMVKVSRLSKAGIIVRDVYRAIQDRSDKATDQSGNMLIGVAFQPVEELTIAIDGYDVLNRLESRAVRIGSEYQLRQGLAFRAGLQKGLDSSWEAWTWGAGIDIANWRVEYAYLGGDYQGIHAMGVTWRF